VPFVNRRQSTKKVQCVHMAKILWHSFDTKKVFESLKSSENGLVSLEVEKRLLRNGKNELPKEESDGVVKVFVRQFTSPLIVILILAAVASYFLHEFVDMGVIIAAIVLNTIIGFVQEYKANKALEHLRVLVQPKATVLRDGREQNISAGALVVGDVLILQTGDSVTADARIFESVDLEANESTLTGESATVEKNIKKLGAKALMAERHNMVFAGTNIVAGRAKAVVVETGLSTELGKIANLVAITKDIKTPLQSELGRLSRWIAILVVGIISVLFVVGVLFGRGSVEMFETSVALAVAAIPEGLLVSVTIILAIGMQRILRRKSLVRRLVAAETLGSVSIICSDKTGTITEGEMRVTDVVSFYENYEFDHSHEIKPGTIKDIFEISALCNDATYLNEEETEIKGSPTEKSLLTSLQKVDVDRDGLIEKHKRIDEIPFSSASKFMITLNDFGKQNRMLLKGAPEKVLKFSSFIRKGGNDIKIGFEEEKEIQEVVADLTSRGLRLIAFGTKNTKKNKVEEDDLKDFVFLGFIGLRDPVRSNARVEIEAAKQAGVRTIMITGDHPETARVIGKEVGLVSGPESVVIGTEIDEWSDSELEKRVNRISIYARVEPRHKIRVIQAWQKRGDVVAMAGDGVNDAPALKAADVGVALGSGTEVAKQAADLVLLNNDLGTITAAIEEGRVVFDNIRKVTVYLMADSFTEIILIGGSILMGLPIPLLPAQILWINLVADSFPNVGLTLEPGEKDVMKLPPRPRTEPVMNKEMMTIVFIIGIVTDLILFALFYWLLETHTDIHAVRSMMFAAVGIDSLFYVFAVKSFRKTIFRINPFSNLWLILGVGIGFGLMLLALIHPFFQHVFEVVPLSLSDWGLLVMIGLVKLVAIELVKEWYILKGKIK
jgi:P-type Ca2+ transporter type 2C